MRRLNPDVLRVDLEDVDELLEIVGVAVVEHHVTLKINVSVVKHNVTQVKANKQVVLRKNLMPSQIFIFIRGFA